MEAVINDIAAPPAFSDNWWDDFIAESNNLTQTTVVPNSISQKQLVLFNKEVIKILQAIFLRKTTQYGLRAYIDGKEKESAYVEKLFEQPPLPDEDIESYADRVFKDQSFGFIINRVEKFSNTLAKELLLLVKPLFDKIGMPLDGISADIFIGNYGWTPFGIHKDRKGEKITHLHLGPGNKTIYTWEDDVYKEHANEKQGNTDIEPMLAYAKKYEFGMGDMYYMPSDKWHVGYSDSLSVGIVLDYLNPTKEVFVSNIFKALTIQYLKKDDTVLNPEKNLSTANSFSSILPTITLSEKLYSLPLEEVMRHLYYEYKNAIISNGGWSNLPLSLKDEIGYDLDNFELLRDAKIITPYPFVTLFEVVDEELVIFARGYKLKIKYHPALIEIINQLNTHTAQSVATLLKPLTASWPAAAGLYFLAMLYDNRAIEIIF
jgi:hypothetical protein